MLKPVENASGFVWMTRQKITSEALNHTIPGFEDVLNAANLLDSSIGESLFENTGMAAGQLIGTLALQLRGGRGGVALALLRAKAGQEAQTIRHMRDQLPLEDLKILDLGCGFVPGFALAARALGAEVHTADLQDLDRATTAQLSSHTVIDLKAPDAIDVLRERTGGDFDIVTQAIIGPLLGQPEAAVASAERCAQLGEALLHTGGYYMVPPDEIYQKC